MKIGIDIGGSHVGVGLIEKDKIIDSEDRILSRDDRHDVKESLIGYCLELINLLVDRNNIEIKDIELIGIAVPGDIRNGLIEKSDNLGLYNFDIVSRLKKFFDIPVQIRNDAKCA